MALLLAKVLSLIVGLVFLFFVDISNIYLCIHKHLCALMAKSTYVLKLQVLSWIPNVLHTLQRDIHTIVFVSTLLAQIELVFVHF